MLAAPYLILTHIHTDRRVLPQTFAQKPQKPSGEHIALFFRVRPVQFLPPHLLKHFQPRAAVHVKIPVHQLTENHLRAAHQRNGRQHILPDFRRVHVNVNNGHPPLNLVGEKMARSAARVPIIIRRSDLARALFADTLPWVPIMPIFKGCSVGKRERPIMVVTTGIRVFSANSRKASSAWERKTPPLRRSQAVPRR